METEGLLGLGTLPQATSLDPQARTPGPVVSALEIPEFPKQMVQEEIKWL